MPPVIGRGAARDGETAAGRAAKRNINTTMHLLPVFVALAQLAALPAQGPSFPKDKHVTAKLSAPASAVAAGGSGKLTLELTIEEKWHIYSSDTTDLGLPTVVTPQFPAGVTGGEIVWPPAASVDLYKLGTPSMVYEGTIQIEIPFTVAPAMAPGEAPVNVNISWQACLGECVEGKGTLATKINIGPPSVAAAQNPTKGPVRGILTKEPPPDRASGEPYKMTVEMELDKSDLAPGDEAMLTIKFDVDAGYHTYSPDNDDSGGMPMRFSSETFEIVGKHEGPEPKRVYDKNLNVTNLEYEGSVVLKQKVRLKAAGLKGKKANFQVSGIVCNASSCLPPADWVAEFDITEKPGGANISNAGGAKPEKVKSGDSPNTPDSGPDVHSLGAFLAWSALGGWASLFTPCVFPMIPITVSFFSKRAKGKRSRSVAMASTYTIGIVGTFTIIGVVVSLLFGAAGLANFATNPWVNLAMGGLFVLLGLSLLGLFNITAPAALTDKVEEAKGSASNDYVMTLLMAIAFTLASFTCTVPVLGTLLTLAARSDSLMRPALGMLAYSSAFAAPFFLLALFPTVLQRLPKGGAWLEVVKISMGFVEFAAALKFLSNTDLAYNWQILTYPVFLVIWIALFAALALYLFGIIKMPGAEGEVGPIRALCATGVLAFSLYLVTGLFGGTFGPFLSGFFPPPEYGSARHAMVTSDGGPGKATKIVEKYAWIEDFDEAKRVAKANNKRIFIDFTGVVCSVCRAAEIGVFPLPSVEGEFNKYVLTRLWLDRVDTPELAKRSERYTQYEIDKFKTTAKPYYAILEPDGETVVGEFGFPGSPDEKSFLSFLKSAAAKESLIK